MGLQERVHLAWISSAEAQRFVEVVTTFTEKIKSLGPNPLLAYQEAQGGGHKALGARMGGSTLTPNACPI